MELQLLFKTCTSYLLGFILAGIPSVGYSQILGKLIAGNQERTINRALADGKSVLIAHKTVFEPLTHTGEQASILGGEYRPPLTYWLRRGTKDQLVLGGYSTDQGRGKLLTPRYHFFIIEPGVYDLVGYVKKTRRQSELAARPLATSPIQSRIGFVNFSTSTLPGLQEYTAWVPPAAAGTTFNGHTLTHWYSPGYYEKRVRDVAASAILIDMRGLVAYDANNDGNITNFLAQPGQIAVVGDFDLDFTYGNCDLPAEGHWVCPLDSLTLAMPFSPQQDDVRKAMSAAGYRADLVNKVDSSPLLPGQFFVQQKMKIAPGLHTTRGEPYAQFRITSNIIRQQSATSE